ncbi:MAG: hypothetical protein ACR2RV_21670, partial [Verrucomicrobiales bacterium]
MAYIIGLLTILVTAVWQIENWRGRQRWEEVTAMVHAAGDDLRWVPPIPAPVPDDQNAARHPVFASAFQPSDSPYGYRLDFAPIWEEVSAGIPTTLDAIVSADPQDVLDNTAVFGDFATELDQAFQRPYCFWFTRDPGLQEGPATFPSAVMGSVTSLVPKFFELGAVRARAHLELGDPDSAVREVSSLIRFARSFGSGTGGLGILVESVVLQIALPEVAEIIAMPGWDDAALIELSGALADLDLLDRTDSWFRSLRAGAIQMSLEYADDSSSFPVEMNIDSIEGLCAHLISHLPRGWYYQNVANLTLWWEEGAFPYYDRSTIRVDPGPFPKPWKTGLTPYTLITTYMMPVPTFRAIYRSVGAQQSAGQLCQLLCSIERFRLDQGELPDRLDQLVPRFIDKIPTDLITGAPPHYARDED